MTDKTELRKLIGDVNEIEKVAKERLRRPGPRNREPGAEVRAILDRWEHDGLIADELRNGSTTRTTIGGNWSDYRSSWTEQTRAH